MRWNVCIPIRWGGMVAKMNHGGLYFTSEQVREAIHHREREPFKTAFDRMNADAFTGSAAVVRAGFLWKFTQNAEAGAAALYPLQTLTAETPAPDRSLIDTISETVALAQAFEMLRDHPASEPSLQTRWLEAFAARREWLSAQGDRAGYVETLWMALLNMAAGVVMDQPKLLRDQIPFFEMTIGDDVRPQGFIPKAVEGSDGGSVIRQVRAASALILMAELAAVSGENIDLWGYSVRGVSAVTAAVYAIYYFYVAAKWKWDIAITPEHVQDVFKQHGGYLEIVYRRTQLKDVKTVLTDLRPMWDAFGGGYTTITHAPAPRRGLFG